MQELRNSNPQFRDLITQRHDDVVRMLREPLSEQEQGTVARMMQQMAMVGEDGEGGEDVVMDEGMEQGMPDAPQQTVISLTQEENAAVHRVCIFVMLLS